MKQIPVVDSLEKYKKSISKYSPLTAEQEAAIARRIKAGTLNKCVYTEDAQKAIDTLVKHNLRFAFKVAVQYQGQGMALEDLINEANLGLIKAAPRFCEKKGFKFISYAVWWIRQSVLFALANQSRMTRIPIRQIASITEVLRVSGELEQKTHNKPTALEIAEAINKPVEEVERILKTSKPSFSFDKHLEADRATGRESTTTFLDTFVDPEQEPTDQQAIEKDEMLSKGVKKILKTLSPIEADVIKMYFGFKRKDGYQATLQDIGTKHGVTRERIRQIKDNVLRQLKSNGSAQFLQQGIVEVHPKIQDYILTKKQQREEFKRQALSKGLTGEAVKKYINACMTGKEKPKGLKMGSLV